MPIRLRLAAFALSGLALLGQAPSTRSQLRFAPGGQVALDLEAGDYVLQPGADDAIVVTWEAPEGGRPDVRLEGTGSRATLVISRTPRHQFRARVELPARCDLRVRLTAGDLTVGPFEGHKDLRLRAGDLKVAIPRPEEYGSVRASVWAGDIHAPAFGGAKDGLFRTFECQGKGPYALRVALWAGDITLSRP